MLILKYKKLSKDYTQDLCCSPFPPPPPHTHNFLSSCAMRIQTLHLRIMSQVFYQPATGPGQMPRIKWWSLINNTLKSNQLSVILQNVISPNTQQHQ